MKVTIKTEVLKELVAKAVRGASNNKLIPITSFIGIGCINNVFSLTTTDATNYLYVETDKIESNDEPFAVTIEAEQFGKLISRMTCDTVTITANKDKVVVEGNGKYTIAVPVDENGEAVRFPNPLDKIKGESVYDTEWQSAVVATILNTAKSSLATTYEVPVYTGYYCKDKIVATDTYKICSINVKLADITMLISAELMNLLEVVDDAVIKVHLYANNVIMFETGHIVIVGKLMPDVEEYAIDAIDGLLNQEFMHVCKVRKSDLLATLDRISLFVGRYDNKEIRLTFTESTLNIESKQVTGTENIKYIEDTDAKLFTCLIDIDMLTQQVKASSADVLEIHYGIDSSIQLVDGNVTQIIALLEES